jgi:hypothetical protein
MELSEHFSLAEMIASDTATRQGINNTPGPHEIDNLRRLCVRVLEPLRAALGQPIKVTSGYRSSLINTLVGGSRSSDHCAGRAADIKVEGTSPLTLAKAIQSLDLPVQQVIHEFGVWVHVSIPPAGDVPRREYLTAVKNNGKTQYLLGLV